MKHLIINLMEALAAFLILFCISAGYFAAGMTGAMLGLIVGVAQAAFWCVLSGIYSELRAIRKQGGF